jgi:hypothetical protein
VRTLLIPFDLQTFGSSFPADTASHTALCSNDTLNDPLLSRLGDNLLRLRSIDIRGCSSVTRSAAQALASRLADRWQSGAKGDAVQYNF